MSGETWPLTKNLPSGKTAIVQLNARSRPSSLRGFARGSFIYGAEAKRMECEAAKEQLQRIGLVVVEGMNDVIALDSFGILSVGLCSNRVSEGQFEKLVRWSNSLAAGKITLMLDNDSEGKAGTQELLLKLGAVCSCPNAVDARINQSQKITATSPNSCQPPK